MPFVGTSVMATPLYVTPVIRSDPDSISTATNKIRLLPDVVWENVSDVFVTPVLTVAASKAIMLFYSNR